MKIHFRLKGFHAVDLMVANLFKFTDFSLVIPACIFPVHAANYGQPLQELPFSGPGDHPASHSSTTCTPLKTVRQNPDHALQFLCSYQ
jgi:hypothetical protein